MPGAAVVTGANRGLGFVVAKGLAERGHAVIAVSRTAAAAGEAVKMFPPPASGAHKPLGIDLASLWILPQRSPQTRYERLPTVKSRF